MIRYLVQLVTLAFIVLYGNDVYAQHFDSEKLSIQWEVVENSHKGKPQFLSVLRLTNKGKNDFPAGGWKIYFNFVRFIDTTSVVGAKIKFINGDLFQLSPPPGFQGIKPGSIHEVKFVSGDWAVNFTDAPTGFYIIWDDAPDKGYTISNYSIKASTEPRQYLRFPEDKIGLVTPQIIYDQNKNTKTLSADRVPPILPTPVFINETRANFDLSHDVGIVADASFRREADYLADELNALLGKRPLVSALNAPGHTKKYIYLTKSDAAMPDEGYRLNITPDNVLIEASSGAGAFYAIQSLKQLMPPNSWAKVQSAIKIPTAEISDEPRFGYRAFFIDVSRNFL